MSKTFHSTDYLEFQKGMEEFDQLLPDSDLFWIDKCGHAAMMEHPDKFNELLYNWLLKRGY